MAPAAALLALHLLAANAGAETVLVQQGSNMSYLANSANPGIGVPYFIQIPVVFDTPGQQKAGFASSNNPALTAEAKSAAQNEGQKRLQAIQTKQNEVQTFIQNTRNSLQQRMQTYKALILEEISKTATTVAQRKGVTLLIDKSGPSLFLIPSVIYSDPGFDITEDVMKEINKDRPAPAAPAAASAAPAAGAPAVNVPGLTPKK